MARGGLSEAISYALGQGFQVHPDALRILESADAEDLGRIIKEIIREKARRGERTIDGGDVAGFLGIGGSDEPFEATYEALADPTGRTATAGDGDGYRSLFASRFDRMRRIVAGRPEAKLLKQVATVKKGAGDKDVCVCGLVWDKKSSGGASWVTIEDPSGSVELVTFDEELRAEVDSLMLDQFVMARVGFGRDGSRVLRELILPDVAGHAPRRSETEAYAVLLSDLHVGSRYFRESEFDDFVAWLSGEDRVASRVGFVLLCGDVVDGVGIYRNQDRELEEKTVESQLAKLDRLVARIPGRIRVVIVPGNHDPGRRALPQPAIPEKYAPGLWARPNVEMLGNPAAVSLNGVRVLMFHGQSIDDVVKSSPGLSYERPTEVMRRLLRARHLCPIYGANTPVAPELDDEMVISEVPDIFHAGHVHIAGAERYRGVLMVNSGAWQGRTPFQESVGIEPTVCHAIVVNLRTLEATQKVFG